MKKVKMFPVLWPVKCIGAMLLLLFCSIYSFGQAKTVTGKVTNEETGKPIEGVTVAIKGAKQSAITNDKGVYSINVSPSDASLVFSFVGMVRQEKKIGANATIDVQLAADNKSLDDVVVVGYGTQKKAHLTAAVETIKGKEIEDLPVGNLGAALQGRVLGLAVSGGISRPGSAASLVLRNPVTLSKDGGGLGPLYVIDGVIQIEANGLPSTTLFNSLDASEIESLTFLKDASAAIYGSRGANGVVLVTTKRGKSGSPRISYSGQFSLNDEAYRPKMLNAYDFAQYMNIMNGPNGANLQPGENNFFTQDELDHFKTINYDWLDDAWKASNNMRHTLNVSGGAERATYFANVSYYSQNGNLSTLDYKRYTFRAGADVNVVNNLKVGLQVSGNYSDREKTFNKIGGENDENDYRNLLLTPPYIPAYVDGYPVRIPGTDQLSQYHFFEIQRLNNLATNKEQFLSIHAYAEYEAPFLKGLKARVSYARNFNSGRGTQVGTTYRLYELNRTGENAHIYDDGATIKSSSTFKNGDRLYYSNYNSNLQQANLVLSYNKSFNKHTVGGLFTIEKSEAFSSQEDVWKESPLQSTNGQFGSAFGAIDGRTSGSETGNLGYIGRLNYSYDDKYLLEFLYRSDASTKFAPENYWGNFYSLSGGWVVSKEKFFNVKAIDYLKIRYSTGLLGRDDTKPWQWRQRYTYQNGKGAVFGSNNSPVSTGMKMEASPNRDATWSNEYKNNLGIDARFLRSRLSATIELFYNKGFDMLLERTATVPVTVGGTLAAENYGKMDFFGYEVGLGWSDKIGRDFNYGVDARFTWYDNKVKQGNFAAILNPWDPQPDQSDDNGMWGYDYLGMFKSQADIDAYVSKEGITSVFGTPAAQLKPGMLYYADVRGQRQPDGSFAGPDGIIDANDQVRLAKKASNHYGFGTTLRASYKGVGLDMVISGSFGGWSEIDGSTRTKLNNNISRVYQNKPEIWNDIYDPVLNPSGSLPNPNWSDISLSPTSDFWRVSSFRMVLRNINLNYTIPKSITQKAKISSARIFLTALNPLTFFNPYSYRAASNPYDVYPELKTYSLGLSATF